MTRTSYPSDLTDNPWQIIAPSLDIYANAPNQKVELCTRGHAIRCKPTP